MKMSRVFSCVVLVCVCCVCVCVRADFSRDVGVKLCGREFIRAVIFTCGGSRWRRSTLDTHLLQLDSYRDSPEDEEGEEGQTLPRPRRAERRAQTDAGRLASPFSPLEGDATSRGNWARPDRRKRNFSLGLAGMCCSHGCTKNDIGRLC